MTIIGKIEKKGFACIYIAVDDVAYSFQKEIAKEHNIPPPTNMEARSPSSHRGLGIGFMGGGRHFLHNRLLCEVTGFLVCYQTTYFN